MTDTVAATVTRPESEPSQTELDICDEATTRDQAWDATMSLISERPIPFQLWRVRRRAGLTRSQDRTIRRTLRVLAASNWLEHEENSNWWYPGEKAKERFAIEYPV